MSRLTIEISEQQHQSVKAMAALNGQSIKEYTLSRLFPSQEEEIDAMHALGTLLQQRIAAAQRGEVSTLDIDAIVEQELRTEG